ncbi:MAG: HlyD family efflux transporter periplasmic adaptor subunit [Bacteroidota bacterium]
MRQVIISLLGLLLIAGAVFGARKMMGSRQIPRPVEEQLETTVFVETVKNSNTPISLTTSGNLRAKKRIELYAEVQGVFETTGRDFLPGEYYKKGAALIRINSQEHEANIRSQKSNLYNQIVAFLPDLKFDYPESVGQWEAYLKDYDIQKPLADFPEAVSEKERLFIAGKNISTSFYNIKNLEERLQKYTIYAPYGGVLTQALVRHGTLIRAGQKLGEFINPNVYELEVDVNSSYADLLKVGKQVQLHNSDGSSKWQGRVVRVNSLVNASTQTIPVFIQVSGQGLKEGMYLEASVQAKEEKNTFELSRKLLMDEDRLFVVRDSQLEVVQVEAVYFKKSTVVVRGLADGTKILSKSIPGSYAGMKVKVFENSAQN